MVAPFTEQNLCTTLQQAGQALGGGLKFVKTIYENCPVCYHCSKRMVGKGDGDLTCPGPCDGYRVLPKHRRTRRKKPGDGVDRVEGLKRCSEGLDGSTSFGTSGPVRT